MKTAPETEKEKKRSRDRAYYAKNRDRILAQTKEWAKKNPERRKEIAKNWYEKNKQLTIDRAVEGAKRSPEKRRTAQRKHYEKKKENAAWVEKQRAAQKKWKDKKRTERPPLVRKCIICEKEFNARTTSKVCSNKCRRARNNQRKMWRYYNDIEFRLREILRNRTGSAIRKGYASGSAVGDLGCSIRFFRHWIEIQFGEGMTWDNHGEWHLDHVRPLAAFDLDDEAQRKEALHFWNYQPLWGPDNMSKNDRDPKETKAISTGVISQCLRG